VLWASLTWDQRPELGKWKQISVDAEIDIFFRDPHARGNAEMSETWRSR
jgi:hypothetical protein